MEGVPVELRLLCGPGVDPHSYGATTRDVLDLERAKAIVYNGFHLEAQLGEVLERTSIEAKSFAMATAFPTAARIDWVEEGEVDANAPFDPHIWNHLPGWSTCVGELSAHLQGIFPEHAAAIAANGEQYIEKITEADLWAAERLSSLPEDRRVLISGHDAFNYFASRYGLETYAVLGVGNDPEADIRTVQEITGIVVERKVPTIFLESITPPRVTQSLEDACHAKGWKVKISDTPLYSDDLGDSAPADTYLGAFRMNVETIVAGLGGAL